ncbi:LysE family translocator [Altericroceibacterium endophyticum]|uniref:LysE family transporter n=1 Tax=Altericroceibacterium endophyticum TaxID=1808508 RepID=A0A6I4T3V3_9SPHN|nr:LysE family translocator [Altericroceibacterium endophyticum]MXO65536.1 LysE family transporter [Altericroceibacterium endophyticum]
MSFETWWLFLGTVFLLSGTPGPTMIFILGRGVELGIVRTMAAMAGCFSSLLLVLGASAAGLTALLTALPGVFDVLRYCGAAYLIYLGIRAWMTRSTSTDNIEDEIPASGNARDGKARLFRTGFIIGISNPKLLVFAAAFLPQFIDSAHPQGPQFAIMVATFAATESFWYFTYATGGKSLAHLLDRGTVRRWINRLVGSVFIGFGAALLNAKKAI